MKRFLFLVVSLTLVAIAVADSAFAEPMEIEPWQNAFLNVLTEKREDTTDDDGIVSYALYDIDRDGTPELFLRFGWSTMGSKCHLYRFTGGSASFVDEFYFGDIELYSVPETSGVLLVYRNMQGKLLTLTDNGSNSIQCFQEFVEGSWDQPFSDFYPGAVVVTEFDCNQDYPLLSYNTWAQPSQPIEETHYPEDNPNFFTNLFIENADVIKVRFTDPWLYPYVSDDIETIGVRDLQETLRHSIFGSIVSNPGWENAGDFDTYLADLDYDGQLEFMLSFQTEKDNHYSPKFTMILSEQNGIVYAYVDDYHAFTGIDSRGILYRYYKDGTYISEHACRVFFDAEDCMSVECGLDEYSGKRYESEEIIGYNMVHYGTQTATSPHYRMFRNYSINEEYGKYGARESYGEKHFTRTVDADMLADAKTYEPETLIQGEYGGYQKGTETAYSFGDDKYVWFIESPVYG